MTMIVFLDIHDLTIEDNPRGSRGRIDDLRTSIANVGLRTPLEVGPKNENDKWPVLGGSRRYRALRQLMRDNAVIPNLTYDRIPCVIQDEIPELDDMALMLANNIQSELPPSLMADALKRITINDMMTVGAISRATAIKPANIRLLLHLADEDPAIRRKVDSGELSLTAYYHLRTAPAEVVDAVLESDGHTTVSDVRRRVERHQANNNPDPLPNSVPDEPSLIDRLQFISDELHDICSGSGSLLTTRERGILLHIRDYLINTMFFEMP